MELHGELAQKDAVAHEINVLQDCEDDSLALHLTIVGSEGVLELEKEELLKAVQVCAALKTCEDGSAQFTAEEKVAIGITSVMFSTKLLDGQ